MKVPFIDIYSQYRDVKPGVDRAMKALFKRGDYVLGSDVKEFEDAFARYIGVQFAVGLNSGTDALFLGLLSLGVGPGDEVIVPSYTYIASAFAVTYTGAKPVFVDIDERSFNIDPRLIERAITKKTKAIMPVHLYGQSADMAPILQIAKKHGLKVIEDAAQAHGTEYRGKKAGSLGDIGAFSFYPTKNLGGIGDGGMALTNDQDIYERLKKLRDYGRKTRYEHSSVGYNSRLDSFQAVFLKEELKKLDFWNKKRIITSLTYFESLSKSQGVRLPEDMGYGRHVFHIFAVRVKKRDQVLEALKDRGVMAAVHYPVPLHLQEVYKSLGHKTGYMPVAEAVCQEVLCLPIYPHMRKASTFFVVKTLKEIIKNQNG